MALSVWEIALAVGSIVAPALLMAWVQERTR